MVCIPLDTFAGPYASCSAHLHSARDQVTKTQASEYTFILYADARTSSIDKFAMGDFNLTPNNVPSVWPGSYVSGVSAWTHPNPGAYEQIDYIWLNNGAISSSSPTIWCISNASDHCEIQASVIR
jgi:endonuclease/exonuclease/phosphatase family metal-dependent hydrolase